MHDKKSNYYTSAESYTDDDGNYKQFTFIDHDVKTKITPYVKMSDDELTNLKKSILDGKLREIEQILELPAVYAADLHNGFYEDAIKRNNGVIEWDSEYIRSKVLLDSEYGRVLFLSVWRAMLPEKYWFDDYDSYENVMSHIWETWINKF